jgi:hypothetical protein
VFRIDDGKLVEDTRRLRKGAEIRAELESQLHNQYEMKMSEI